MAIQVVTIVKCDGCATYYELPTGKRADAHKARKKARFSGWWAYLRREGRMVDLCPECLERIDENQH